MIPYVMKETAANLVLDEQTPQEFFNELKEENPNLISYIISTSKSPELESSVDYIAGAIMMYQLIKHQMINDGLYGDKT